ncbi:50S ribosomal protein L19-2, chloroplastic-like [Telopea speciosissima]|uniref:50S ribosomal protein L19-2, chloroplastic-like n=1 Tax=Telopea speciosissima TaxID=54955 RepID=UPI001CC36A24|nr:50S ribosomal protein L19-2, chloroplastic-like [Telopea speciosissima]
MASKALPQALVSIPRTATPCSSKKLGSSSLFSFRSSSFCSTRIITSRVSSNGFDLKFNPVVTRRKNPLFVVRAESNSEGEVEATENAEEKATVDPEVPATEPESEIEIKAEAVAVVEAVPKPPRKPRVKLGDIMGILHNRAIEAAEKERPVPDIRTGDVVEIKLEVPENRRRLSIYKGIVMSKQNAGIHTTIRIRRIVAGIGVEIVFPVYSPNIKELKVVSHRKVRRARLYYLRDKLPRFSTFK